MIEALIGGERDPVRLAGLARGRLRAKLDDLAMACDGRFTAGHAQLCRMHLDAYDLLTGQIATLDQLVEQAAEPFAAVIARLVTIPGIGPRIAAGDRRRDRRRHGTVRHQRPARRLGRAGARR